MNTDAKARSGDVEPDEVVAIKNEYVIQDVSAWILRIGVVLSAAIMILGLTLSFIQHSPTVREMVSRHFQPHPAMIWRGIKHGRGVPIIELGIVLLVLTPIARVAASVVLFAFYDRDWLYTVVTLGVLLLTLASLFLLR